MNNYSQLPSYYEILGEFSKGAFGRVLKVKNIIDKQCYAIKIITPEDDSNEAINKVLREVETLAKIKSEYVVRYFHSWKNDIFVFIQMELCADNLQNIIERKRQLFKRRSSNCIDAIEYQISLEIFRELLECVQYLHELDPPIIHRDLKPQNVLVMEKANNGKYLKICDFGLAKFYMKTDSLTSGIGTFGYMAPEIYKEKYNYKVDIFSLGKILEDLTDLDINGSLANNIKPQKFYLKLNNLLELIKSMESLVYSNRPSCAQILRSFNEYAFNEYDLMLIMEEIIRFNNLSIANDGLMFQHYALKTFKTFEDSFLESFSTKITAKTIEFAVRTPNDPEYLFKETENEVFKELNDSNCNAFSSKISFLFSKRLDNLRAEFEDKYKQKWDNEMKQFIDTTTEDFKNKMRKTSSVKIFNSLKEYYSEEALKQFDNKFNKSDSLIDYSGKMKIKLKLQLENIIDELHKDLRFEEEFEKYIEQSLPEYDRTMKTLINLKLLESKPNVLYFKLNRAQLTSYHILAKDSIFKSAYDKHHLMEEKKHKFSSEFEERLINVLEQKYDNYVTTLVCVDNYLKDWKKEQQKNDLIENTNEKNLIIIQRRKLLFDIKDVQEYSLELFEMIYTDIKQINENKKCELREKYETLFWQTMVSFENQMRETIQSRLHLQNYNLKLAGVYENESIKFQEYFKVNVKKFDSTNSFREEYLDKLVHQMAIDKGIYETVLDQVGKYRNDWINQLNDSRYLPEGIMQQLNEQLQGKFKSTGNELLDEIYKQSSNKIFEELVENVKKIEKREIIIEENITNCIIKLFQDKFNKILEYGHFNQIEVNAMFNKLLKHTEEVFKTRCNFNEHQKELENKGITKLNVKLRQYLKKEIVKHSLNSQNIIRQEYFDTIG